MKSAKEWTNELDQAARQRGFYDQCLYMVKKIQEDALPEWHDLRKDPEDLPESEKVKLIIVNNGRMSLLARAYWVDEKTLEANEEHTDFGEWDEETDIYYCPKGWYEFNLSDEIHMHVNDDILAWSDATIPEQFKKKTEPV